ncbi:hypothetical protein JCM33374_g6361 [Metschnikowia sp. JCM 33374]|nr:hypothetical protein JCM33374_g6361 [Metschnikowia sp. JCM 33374]
MTTTERSVPTSPQESHSSVPNMTSKSEGTFVPRGVTFSEGTLLKVPSELSITTRSFSDVGEKSVDAQPSHCDKLINNYTDKDAEISKNTKLQYDIDGVMNPSPLLQPTYIKSKRSSSASNDSSHERDRFRARFESFNPPKSAIIEDQPEMIETGYEECEEISSKTKKLNIEHSLTSYSKEDDVEFPLEKTEKASTSPLDRKSKTFSQYGRCSDSEATRVLDLRMISPKQLSQAFSWYFNNPLPPTNHMFPWLHGLHPENFAQSSFFGSQSKNHIPLISKDFSLTCAKPEQARFIMCVEISGPTSRGKPNILRNTVAVEEILQRIEVSRSEMKSLVKILVARSFPQNRYPYLEISNLTESIIMDCLATGYMPTFVDSDPKRGISLRNFQIQVNKAAKCSDLIVYCHEWEDESCRCKCMAFARLLKIAQVAEDVESPLKFDVFVFGHQKDAEKEHPEIWTVRDSSSVLAGVDAKKKTQLHLHSMVHFKSDTFCSWDADYQVKEKLETTVMSSATKLNLNVWSGNIWDHQIMMQYLKGESEFQAGGRPEIIPNDGNKDKYCDPKHSLLTRKFTTSKDLNLLSILPPPRSHWQLFIHCHNDASFPSQDLLSDLLFKYTITSRKASEVSDIHQLDFPSSGSIGFGDCRQENLMSIVNTCKLLYLYSSSLTEDSLASLIYCSDGYTESSLLVFCFLMYAEDIPLETAMLKLHLEYGRPFYVFNSDVQVLRKLEGLLRKYSPARLGERVIWSQGETISQKDINEILLKPKGHAGQNKNVIPRKFRLGYIASESSSESDDSDSETERAQIASSSSKDRNWVEELEGSLPSRILPYIYLGSLKHANNLTVLNKLGISKVISVGESLEWLNKSKFHDSHDIIVDESKDGNVETFNIKSKSPKHLQYGHHCNISSVMKLNNLQDDGIDNLSLTLPRILEHIDEEYKRSGGKTKFLIHCRVGVSRSATVVIAEVMRRLKLTLPQAYLYVRVRRLNIVIQPNLRFMYELFKWEEQERNAANLRRQTQSPTHSNDLRVIDWFVMCQEIKKLNMPFLRH